MRSGHRSVSSRGTAGFDELTGREQLEYFGRLRDLPAAEMETRITDWLDRFDLSDDADKRIDDYSKGMRQRLG